MNNHIANFELRTLNHARLFKNRLFYIIVIAGFGLIATIPYFTYIDHPNSSANHQFLSIVNALIFGFCCVIDVLILVVTLNSLHRDRTSQHFDQLMLTGIDANTYILGKWWGLTRYCLHLSLVTIFFRFTLAWSMIQYLHRFPSTLVRSMTPGTEAFYYSSSQYLSHWNAPLFPELIKVLLCAGGITIYSFCECGLLTAIGMMTGLFTKPMRIRNILIGVFVRLAIALITVSVVIAIGYLDDIAGKVIGESVYGLNWQPRFAYTYPEVRGKSRVMETLQAGVSVGIDAGSLLGANIMRPRGSPQFVLRNLVAIPVGIGWYALFVWICLSLAV